MSTTKDTMRKYMHISLTADQAFLLYQELVRTKGQNIEIRLGNDQLQVGSNQLDNFGRIQICLSNKECIAAHGAWQYGDTVCIKNEEELDKLSHIEPRLTSEMKQYFGQSATILERNHSKGWVRLNIDKGAWWWAVEWLDRNDEPVEIDNMG
jgi:hypothetical protein